MDGLFCCWMGYLLNSHGMKQHINPGLLPSNNFALWQSTAFGFGPMMTARFFLGIFEAGFGPAIPLYFCGSIVTLLTVLD